MGLFDRNKKKMDVDILKNAINVNDLDTNARICISDWFGGKKGKLPFSNFYLQLVLNKIYQGLQNVLFYTTDIDYLGNDICNFFDKNCSILIHSYFQNGYICVINDKNGLRLPYQNELRIDGTTGYIQNRNAICIYSDYYSINRQTHFSIIKPILKSLDTNSNNSLFASDNLGALGILSSKSIPLSPAGKEELNQHLMKYGLSEDQFRFILTNQEMSYTPINLPIKDLDFSGKVDKDLKYIAQFFNVPIDMVFGESSYANQEQAILLFYENCIAPLAEILLKLARTTYVYLDTKLTPSTIVTYKVVGVPQLESSIMKESEEQIKYLELLDKLNDMGIDVSDEINKVYGFAKKMIADV